MSPPSDITSLRRFLGMMNQIAKFVPNVAEISKPLRELLQKNYDWTWDSRHMNRFQN